MKESENVIKYISKNILKPSFWRYQRCWSSWFFWTYQKPMYWT